LRNLYLGENQLAVLPQWVTRLADLRDLEVDANQLTALPEWVGDLMRLRFLLLSNNELTALPESWFQFTHLQRLFLGDNHFTRLPEVISQFANLLELNVKRNGLTVLPRSLGRLAKLEILDLSGNHLRTLPGSLGNLTSLRELDLSGNQLRALPASLGRLRVLERLVLDQNPDLQLSAEVLGPTKIELERGKKRPDPQTILAFYYAQRKLSAKPLNEVKLLLVGHGRVGKTSISKALREVPHDEKEPETPGIERNPLLLPATGPTIVAHIWDFGGQEFLHQTHQFFFSKRSIYAVVLSGRQGQAMQEAEYWLRLIRTYGTGSPVVIVLNQIKTHPFTVDEYFLQENYPEVKAIVRTDCAPTVGIDPLRKLLGKLAFGMLSVRERIDPSWARVRTRLEEMNESYVSFVRYRDICAEEGVTTPETQETLATILDYLGVALNYRDDPRLRETSVLKPRWLVDGIYTILRWLHKQQTNGEMRLEDFPRALKSQKAYPTEMHKFLLDLMEKFELCFQLEGENGVYLVRIEEVHEWTGASDPVPLRRCAPTRPAASFHCSLAHVE
jgi:internalin A